MTGAKKRASFSREVELSQPGSSSGARKNAVDRGLGTGEVTVELSGEGDGCNRCGLPDEEVNPDSSIWLLKTQLRGLGRECR
jgi:hypothetical protein